MNYFSKKNVVTIVIAILLIINIASISTIVYHSYQIRKAIKSEPERTSMRVFSKELNLNQQQIGELGELGKNFRDETREILDRMHKIRMELINEMSSANPDTAKMFAMADNIGILHAQIKHKTIEHFMVIKNNCTPDQFERFVKIFQRTLMEDDFGRWTNRQRQGNGKGFQNGRPPRIN